MDEQKRDTVSELRERLRQAEVDAGYWRGRAESLEGLMAQRSQQSASGMNLPPELLASLLAAKMKEKQDGG